MKQPGYYSKKPVVIQAVQLTWGTWSEICEFVPKPWFVRGVWLDEKGEPLPEGSYRFEKKGEDPNSTLGLIIKTLESNEFLARGGDWIIKGIKGEFYACKPDIFEQTYQEECGFPYDRSDGSNARLAELSGSNTK